MVHEVLNPLAYRILNRRTVAGIQEKIIEKCGRNLLSRLANAKNDKEMIATWKSDLNRILHVFNVCPVITARILLTVHSQTELAITTHVIVSDVHHGVMGTHAMVSEIHRSVIDQKGTDNQHRSVSDICISFHHRMNKRLPPPRHQPGQQLQLSVDPTSYICI